VPGFAATGVWIALKARAVRRPHRLAGHVNDNSLPLFASALLRGGLITTHLCAAIPCACGTVTLRSPHCASPPRLPQPAVQVINMSTKCSEVQLSFYLYILPLRIYRRAYFGRRRAVADV
jgi:hypothetical protein